MIVHVSFPNAQVTESQSKRRDELHVERHLLLTETLQTPKHELLMWCKSTQYRALLFDNHTKPFCDSSFISINPIFR